MSEPSHERLMLTDASYKAGYSIAQAENARLQEQVKEADEVMGLAIAALNERVQEVDLLKRERDDYKARDKLRGEALEPFARVHRKRVEVAPRTAAVDSPIPVYSYGSIHIWDKHFREADAALNTPLEKGEKD